MADSCLHVCTIKAELIDLLNAVPAIDVDNPPKIYVQSSREFFHGDALVIPFTKSASFNVGGSAEIDILETASINHPLQIYITIPETYSTRIIQMVPAVVPDQDECELTKMTIAKPFGYS